MRKNVGRAFVVAWVLWVGAGHGLAQADRDYSGEWRLDAARSDLRVAAAPAASLDVTQTSTALMVATSTPDGGRATLSYPLDGKPVKSEDGDGAVNTLTKWEGAVLLVNMNVSGAESYSISERWSKSRDGSRLTIERTVNIRGRETEAVLVYENPAMMSREREAPVPAANQPRATAQSLARAEPAAEAAYTVTSGSRILTRLTNSIDTKRTVVGDRLYLQTAAPVFIRGRLVVPQGSYVTASVTEVQRAGKVKGKSGLNLRFESLTLPNGVSRDFRSRAGSVDTRGSVDRNEGRIEGESNRGSDARTVAGTTAAGTGVGAVIGAASGHVGAGAGIGAAAGALGGLIGVMSSRGPEVVLPAGTTMEMVLDRDVQFTETELGRIR